MTTWQPTTPEHPPTTETDLDLGLLENIENAPPLPGRERVTSNFTFVLLGLFALVGAFTLGAWFQRAHGPAESTATAAGTGSGASTATVASGATIPTGSRGGQGAAGLGGGGQFAGGGGTVGTVKLVDGTNVYLTDASGNLVKVTTQPGLVVTVNKDGTVADLAPGETVVVTGTAGSDGSIAATAIRSGTALAGVGNRGAGAGGGSGAGAGAPTTTGTPTTSR